MLLSLRSRIASRRRGVVLIAVLLIVVVLSLAAYQYGEWVTAENRAADGYTPLGADAGVCSVRRELYRCHDQQFGCVYEYA